MTVVAIILSVISVILTAITSIFSFMAYAKVVGMEKSTHKIQYVPVPTDEEGGFKNPTGDKLKDKMKEAFYEDDMEAM